MAPIPKLYRATNEVTGEMMIDIATVLAKRLCTVQHTINTYAQNQRLYNKQWRIRLVRENEDDEIWFMSDTNRIEWEEVCKPFREVSKKRRKRNAITNTGTEI